MQSIFSEERRAFLRRACQLALLTAGTGAGVGCGGSGGSDSSSVPGGPLTPAGTAPTRYSVRRLFGATPGGNRGRSSRQGRTSDESSAWWEYRQERFGKINNRGDVAASVIENNFDLGPAAIYRGGQLIGTGVPAPPEGFKSSEVAFDINDRGQTLILQRIYRYVETSYGESSENLPDRLFLCENGAARRIELPYLYSSGKGINNRGEIVGGVTVSENEYDENGAIVRPYEARCFLWRDGQIELFGSPRSGASDINDAGQVLGAFYTTSASDSRSSDTHLVVWQNPQTMVDLNLPETTYPENAMINEEGVVLASPGLYGNGPTYLWTPERANGAEGSVTQVTALPPGFVAGDMNRKRDFVGSAPFISSDAPRWNRNLARAYRMRSGASTPEDLNTLIPADSGWRLEYAYGINDVGQITGVGFLQNGDGTEEAAVFLLTPLAG